MEIIRYIMEAEKLFEINDLQTLKQAFDSWCTNVKVLFIAKGYDQWLPDLEVKMHYLNNEYSDEETRKSLLAALKECVSLLEYCNGPHTLLHSNEKVRLAEQILDNFKFYYRSMFQYPLSLINYWVLFYSVVPIFKHKYPQNKEIKKVV